MALQIILVSTCSSIGCGIPDLSATRHSQRRNETIPSFKQHPTNHRLQFSAMEDVQLGCRLLKHLGKAEPFDCTLSGVGRRLQSDMSRERCWCLEAIFSNDLCLWRLDCQASFGLILDVLGHRWSQAEVDLKQGCWGGLCGAHGGTLSTWAVHIQWNWTDWRQGELSYVVGRYGGPIEARSKLEKARVQASNHVPGMLTLPLWVGPVLS